MRPTIINNKIIKAIENVVNDDINSIILTDDELVAEVNEKLKGTNKFSYSAFKDWKSFAIGNKKEEDTSEENYKLYMKLGSVIKRALKNQKKNLFTALRNEPTQWQKWAWIIERKFNDWNIKKQIDVTTKGESINEESREKAKKAISGFMPEDTGGGQ